MNNTGGRYTLEINGRRFSGRAKATAMTAGVSIENGANQDGTGFRTVKAQLVSLDLTFDRGIKLKWDTAMLLENLNVTWREDDAKVTHTYTDANWSGTPSLDSETGEVSGLKIECPDAQYQQI